jgi:hypothetical protein
MPAFRTIKLSLLLALTAVTTQAQPPPPDEAAVRSGVEQILSLATFGAVTVRDQDTEISRSGADYQVRLKLTGFAAPPDAAINAVVRPLANGLLDIASMAFPVTGTIETAPSGGAPGIVSYSLGQQTVTGRVDPTLMVPSSYEAAFGQIRLTSDHGDLHAEQTIDRYAANGTLSADAAGLLTLASQGSGTGYRFTGRGDGDFVSEATARALAGHFSVEGLDRAQGARLLSAARGLAGADSADRTPGGSPQERQSLRAMVDATSGLLTRFDAEETLEDIRFAISGASGAAGGTIGRFRLGLTGDAVNQRLNGRFAILAEGIATTAMAGENAAFVPHHVDLRAVLVGVRVGPLLALLRQAAASGADFDGLQSQAMALFSDPQARVGIEALSFDSGPLQISGTARAVPRANGQLGAEIHIAASGVDTLLAQAQSRPDLQRILPMVFMAKGMGRAQGNALVWDISLGDGPPKINGVPFGQPAARTR